MRKPVTINTVAKAAGVAKSTVSKCLSGNKEIPAATARKIKKIAQKLNYRPSVIAQGLAGKQTKTIGIIAPLLNDEYCVEIINAQINFLQKHGFSCILNVTNFVPKIEHNCIDQTLDKGADGLLVNYPILEKTALKKLAQLNLRNFPVVIFGNSCSNISSIDLDFFEAYYTITKHLMEKGHQKIGYLFGGEESLADPRAEGALKAHQEAGLELNRSLVVRHEQQRDQEHVFSVLKKAITELKSTAIVCYCDDLALNVLGHLHKMGLSVPNDISLVSVNDVFFAKNALVPLTTYAWPIAEIGSFTASKLLEKLDNPNLEYFHKVFKGKLIIRESAGSVTDPQNK